MKLILTPKSHNFNPLFRLFLTRVPPSLFVCCFSSSSVAYSTRYLYRLARKPPAGPHQALAKWCWNDIRVIGHTATQLLQRTREDMGEGGVRGCLSTSVTKHLILGWVQSMSHTRHSKCYLNFLFKLALCSVISPSSSWDFSACQLADIAGSYGRCRIRSLLADITTAVTATGIACM